MTTSEIHICTSNYNYAKKETPMQAATAYFAETHFSEWALLRFPSSEPKLEERELAGEVT